MIKIKIRYLFDAELTSGLLLMISFALAVLVANIDPFANWYRDFVFLPITIGYQDVVYQAPFIQVVNDGLMTLFFLLIGLELKFHLVCGEFKEKKTLVLPGAAAIGGVVCPAAIYWCFNFDASATLKGWAIPIATDTAFMLGILSFFKSLLSTPVRAFIIGFSLIDDAIALLILAIFYTQSGHPLAIFICIGLVLLLIGLNRLKITSTSYYLGIGILLWIAMVEAGIHGTLAGIGLALAIPVQTDGAINPSFHRLEHQLRPIVYFLILPIFAFINSGIDLNAFQLDAWNNPLALGIIFGLLCGKQLGIFLFSYLAVKCKTCTLPAGLKWLDFYGISVLGGIGFTLSLFIGDLTFEAIQPNFVMRVSVITASILSAVWGLIILWIGRYRTSRTS